MQLTVSRRKIRCNGEGALGCDAILVRRTETNVERISRCKDAGGKEGICTGHDLRADEKQESCCKCQGVSRL